MLLLWLTSNQYAINILTFLTTERNFTTRRPFFIHAAWLRQGSPHCAIFPTAASRRSLGRVSVPVWLAILSDQLEIVGLVGLYPTNYLISLGFIPWQVVSPPLFISRSYCGISHRFQWLSPSKSQIPKPYSPVRHSSALKASFQPVTVRLACVKPAASVQSEP